MHSFAMRFHHRVIISAVALFVTLSASGQPVPLELYSGLHWRLIGPFRGGRAVASPGIPGNPPRFTLERSMEGSGKPPTAAWSGSRFSIVKRVASIGALAVAPSDPKVIYAGTGESDIRSDSFFWRWGLQVDRWRADVGECWLARLAPDQPDCGRSARIANMVYVAVLGHAYAPNAERGVYKSSDGGSNWTRVLDQGPETGAAI